MARRYKRKQNGQFAGGSGGSSGGSSGGGGRKAKKAAKKTRTPGFLTKRDKAKIIASNVNAAVKRGTAQHGLRPDVVVATAIGGTIRGGINVRQINKEAKRMGIQRG